MKLPDGSVLPVDLKFSDDTLRATLETLLAQVKASGQLTGPVATGDLCLVRLVGQPVRVNL